MISILMGFVSNVARVKKTNGTPKTNKELIGHPC